MPRIVIHSRDGHNRTVTLKEGNNRIGRARDNDIVIDDPSVSQYHCNFAVRINEVTVTDLESTNGVSFEGKNMQTIFLEPDQEICLGNVNICLLPPRMKPLYNPKVPRMIGAGFLLFAIGAISWSFWQMRQGGVPTSLGTFYPEADLYLKMGSLFLLLALMFLYMCYDPDDFMGGNEW